MWHAMEIVPVTLDWPNLGARLALVFRSTPDEVRQGQGYTDNPDQGLGQHYCHYYSL